MRRFFESFSVQAISAFSAGCLLSVPCFAVDWGGQKEPIEGMFIYPTYAVIVQKTAYAGVANCRADEAWDLVWSDFDAATQQRIYSTLMAAYLAQKPIMAIFNPSGCGPEGRKKFSGHFFF